VGSDKFNERLSIKRAETVQKFLWKRGISKTRIRVEGKGMSQPIKDNDTEEHRAINRRVEIFLLRD
jgi:OOP family OmpA-OmpF porin